MTSDTQRDLISELAKYVEPWTPERVTAAVAALSVDQVKMLYARIRPINKRDAAIQAAAKKRLEGLMKVGEEWADPDTNAKFEWAEGESDDWKVADPIGFRSALAHVKHEHECATTGVTCVRPSCRCNCPGCANAALVLSEAELNSVLEPTFTPKHAGLNKMSERGPRLREVIADYRSKPATKPDLREVAS
jgi:hypothetical protein